LMAHSEHACLTSAGANNEIKENFMPARKKQRRLTHAQQVLAGAIDQCGVPIARKPAAIAPKAEEQLDAPQAAEPPVALEQMPVAGLARGEEGDSSEEDSDVCSSDANSEDSDMDDGLGYHSAFPSVKVVPGKRIKWRNAINENDTVRQDLSMRFLREFVGCDISGGPQGHSAGASRRHA